MTGGYQKPGIAALYDLEMCKSEIGNRAFQIAGGVRSRLRADFGEWTDSQCDAQIRKIVGGLSPGDFGFVDFWRPGGTGPLIRQDVYGARDEYGAWFVKFAVVRDRTRLYSCHLAERDLQLACGTILRVKHV